MLLEPDDDQLNNTLAVLSPHGTSPDSATPEDVAYESGFHDGIDYGYRLALTEVHTLYPDLPIDPTSDVFQEAIF